MNLGIASLRALIGLFVLVAGSAAATSVAPKSLEVLVPQASEIVVARIDAVDVVDPKGRALQGKHARTGPGLDNRMRFHLRIDEVIRPQGGSIPQTVVVPLWSMWHYDLESMRQQVLGQRGIFLLKAGTHEPVYPAYFQRTLDEREEIEALLPSAP
jgi:hypothetical protein